MNPCQALGKFIFAYFVVELAIKNFGHGRHFLDSPWNMLDISIIFAQLVFHKPHASMSVVVYFIFFNRPLILIDFIVLM